MKNIDFDSYGEYFLYIIVILIVSWIVYSTLPSKLVERFGGMTERLINLFNIYNTSFGFMSKLTVEEEDFIIKSLKLVKKDNLENKDVLPYNFGVRLNRGDDKINCSRFNIATLNNNKKFEKNILEMLNDIGIDIKENRNYNYYGVGWDLEENKIKVNMIHEHKRRMVCYSYKVVRDKKKIVDTEFIDMKYYIMTKGTFLMFKKGETIKYDNNVKIKNSVKLDYPNCMEVVKTMEDKGFKLRSYSNYNNTLNLYFD